MKRVRDAYRYVEWDREDAVETWKQAHPKRNVDVHGHKSYLFLTSAGTPVTYSAMYNMLRTAGGKAGFNFNAHPHMLRHSYASMAYQGKLAEFGMTCSMSRKGNCWDNSPTESWFNSFKNERYHGVRYATQAEVKAASFEYIEVFYNRKRQHSTLGYKSPIQFLKRWISEQNQEKQAA